MTITFSFIWTKYVSQFRPFSCSCFSCFYHKTNRIWVHHKTSHASISPIFYSLQIAIKKVPDIKTQIGLNNFHSFMRVHTVKRTSLKEVKTFHVYANWVVTLFLLCFQYFRKSGFTLKIKEKTPVTYCNLYMLEGGKA